MLTYAWMVVGNYFTNAKMLMTYEQQLQVVQRLRNKLENIKISCPLVILLQARGGGGGN